MSKLPLEIRKVSPGPGFTKLDLSEEDGKLREGVHTGGVWVSPDGTEFWKPLDGKPWANARHCFPTQEAECLKMMSGQPAFPRNWRVEEAGQIAVDGVTYTRRWLVRGKAWVVGKDYSPRSMRIGQVLEIERGLRELNRRRWTIGDRLSVAFDRNGVFILDLSCASPDNRADDEWRFLKWLRKMGIEHPTTLRQKARHLASTLDFLEMTRSFPNQYHIYASRNRPVSGVWAQFPEGTILQDADYAETGVWTWIIVPGALDNDTLQRYELVWGWSPITYTEEAK